MIDHLHERLVLRQAQGVNLALLRIGGGDRFIIHMGTLDSSAAQNDSCRFYGISNSAIVHSKVKGGIYNIGVSPGDVCCFPRNLIDHWVMNVTFEYNQPNGPGYPAAINIRHRVRKVVLDNVRVTGGTRFADIDGPAPNSQDPHPIVEIRCCTFNGNPVTLANLQGDLTNVTILPCQ